MNKLTASSLNFHARGMLNDSIWANHIDPPWPPVVENEDDDGGAIDDRDIQAVVQLVKESSVSFYFIRPYCNLIRDSSSYPPFPSTTHGMVTHPIPPFTDLSLPV